MMAEVYLEDKPFSKLHIYPLDKCGDTLIMTVEETRLANFRLLIEAANGPSAAAQFLEMSPSQLSQIAGRNPTRNIGTVMARKIEAAWKKPKGWLDLPQDRQLSLNEPRAEYNNIASGPEIQQVPLISWVQAGQWKDLIDNLSPGESYKLIHTTARVGPRAYALRIVGDSMTNPSGSPSFPENTIIILDPDRHAEPGKFVVVRQNGDTECTFKQLIRDSGSFYLKPLNPRYPILQMRDDAVICGVLAQAVMDF